MLKQNVLKLKSKLGPLWWHTGLMFVSSRLGDLISMYIGLFIVPDVLSKEDLGSVLPLVRLAGLIAVPMTIVGNVAMKYVSIFVGTAEAGKVKLLLKNLVVLNTVLSLLVVSALLFCWRFIKVGLKIEDDRILWILVVSAIISCWSPVVTMVSSGLKRFYRITMTKIIGPVIRLVVVMLLINRLQLLGYLSGNLAQSLAILFFLASGFARYMRSDIKCESYDNHKPEMLQYLRPIAVTTIVLTIQLVVEPWMVRQLLSSGESAGYYMAAMFGNIPMWVAPAMMPFLFPLVSEYYEKGRSTRRIHLQALCIICVIGFGVSFFFLFAGDFIIGLRSSWSRFSDYTCYIPLLGLVASLDIFMKCHIVHESACRQFGFLKYFVPIVICELFFFLIFAVLPSFLDDPFGGLNLLQIVTVILVSRILVAVFVCIQLMRNAPVSVGLPMDRNV